MTRRRSADLPVFLLLGLGLALLAALAAHVARHALPYGLFAQCETPQATFLARLGTLGVVLPAALAAEILVATGLALAHQLWATRRTLNRVLAHRVAMDRRLARLAGIAGLSGRLDLVADETVFTFCYGLRRPRVCISSALVGMLDDAELLAVLRHEAHHLRHHDPVKILTSRALSSGLFFLPLAGALHDGYLAAKELCADADAAPGGDELPLARALVKMLGARRPSWPAGVLAVGSLSPTEARLQRLLGPDEGLRSLLPTRADWAISAAIVAAIFGFSHGAVSASAVAPLQDECGIAPAVSSTVSAPGPAASGARLRFEPLPMTVVVRSPAPAPEPRGAGPQRLPLPR
jgi:Zn-dependent protease with chaperone function